MRTEPMTIAMVVLTDAVRCAPLRHRHKTPKKARVSSRLRDEVAGLTLLGRENPLFFFFEHEGAANV